jgi:formate dehydrogenase assembly factor FdhD
MVFGIGFVIGYLINSQGISRPSEIFNTKQQSKNDINKKSIEIDTTKVVLDIKTDNLEKKYNNIAESQITQTNIGSSINKLKNLKG